MEFPKQEGYCLPRGPGRKQPLIHLLETVNILLELETLIKNTRDPPITRFVVHNRFEINNQITFPSLKAENDYFYTIQVTVQKAPQKACISLQGILSIF